MKHKSVSQRSPQARCTAEWRRRGEKKKEADARLHYFFFWFILPPFTDYSRGHLMSHWTYHGRTDEGARNNSKCSPNVDRFRPERAPRSHTALTPAPPGHRLNPQLMCMYSVFHLKRSAAKVLSLVLPEFSTALLGLVSHCFHLLVFGKAWNNSTTKRPLSSPGMTGPCNSFILTDAHLDWL